MKKYNIGFIGCGKMAGAIIKGVLKSGTVSAENIIASQAEAEGIKEKSASLGIEIVLENTAVVEKSDVIFIATKPNQVENVLKEISASIKSDKIIVSIAAGVNTKKFEAFLPKNAQVIRVMPNTPVLVGEGMSAIFAGKNVLKDNIDYIYNLLSTVGKCILVEKEAQIDIVTAISGSGPAFFYKIINDFACAGKVLGLDYEKALQLSIQTAIGSAKMAANRTSSMEELISNVATKGGCTRVGVDVMEEADTTKLFAEVIAKTTQKASELGK